MRRKLRDLKEHTSGVAMVEFAFTAPIFLGLGMLGTETAYFTITHMQISQIAMQVADNASRVGEADVLVNRQVFEDDINQAFIGAEKLGEQNEIFTNGRIILSSLEVNADGGQWIHWQRCRGAKVHDSSFGVEGDGETGTDFDGMGETGKEITASSGTAVMFVEVSYTYTPVTPFEFYGDTEIQYTAAFNVRDQRDLTQLYQTNPVSPVADCDTYSADRPA
ncbi:TadE/TadG family type IV pilus assembly protein [Erythrobacter crassostreae]|uniref:Pilus assembly protein n=1 Tax=Erythrobacter crassostreae TaxID=2828328 RepID=A0A9X1JLK8_9SPHN|nr:TadE/TadG family type IV pilus assembly protein [Erythrobacter crassostrea]MBV7260260.1 pilus assembly protein [Erythrobacter crassostrea]